MHALDLETDIWSDLGMEAPKNDAATSGVLYASHVFREGNRLYRLRGMNEYHYLGGDRVDVFDADRKMWEPKVDLYPYPVPKHRRVMLKVKIVIKKN